MTSIILIGASTRAAAVSARRAGWTPWCADLFADADLERIATVHKVPMAAYPQGLVDALKDAPDAPVMYTGALENWPGLIATIDRPLWGNPPNLLRAARTPERWTLALRSAGIACPNVSREPQIDGAWLLKPRKSAGGLGIHEYARQPFKPRGHFLQERIDGVPCSAVFLGTDQPASVLCGVSRQLVGVKWLNARGYQYCGNIGPLPLAEDATATWHNIGAVLARYGLRGLFGVDAVVKAGVPWPVEINPRYTASLELLERSFCQALLPLHRAIFEQTPMPAFPMPAAPPIWGKAILYARRSFAFPAVGPWLEALADGVDLDEVEYADIPHAGTVIEQGRPLLTIFAAAQTVAGCETKLQEKAQDLDRRLWG